MVQVSLGCGYVVLGSDVRTTPLCIGTCDGGIVQLEKVRTERFLSSRTNSHIPQMSHCHRAIFGRVDESRQFRHSD